MSLDARIKRFFPLIVCAMIALAAYFQASGIANLLGSSIGDEPAAKPPAAPGGPAGKQAPSARPILQRNPFDSETGSLLGEGDPLPFADGGGSAGAGGGPGGGEPRCGFGRVVLIAAAEDPEWSFAAVETPGSEAQLRRVGDVVEGHTLEALVWDRVWFVKDASRCQLQVGDRPVAAKAGRQRKPSTSRRRGGRSSKLPPELAAKIHKVSDNEFNVERAAVDELLERQSELMRSARLRPVKQGDKVVGLQLSRVKSGSLFDALGLKNGDQLQSINGFELTNPQKALEAYGRLRTADRLTLRVLRGGGPQTIEFNIR